MGKGRIVVDVNLCKGCELCTEVCPKDILQMDYEEFTPSGYHPASLVDPDGACTGCAICAIICPDVAIRVYRWTSKN